MSPQSKKIAAVILAAGGSTRLGKPKQLLKFAGKSLVGRITDAAREANCSPVIVVLGSDAELVRRELGDAEIMTIENNDWQLGIGTSIRTGIRYLIDNGADIDAVVLLVCDQPFVDADVIKQLIALRKRTEKTIVACSYTDTLGVPALFDRSCFDELLALEDSTGAKSIILSNRERVALFEFRQGQIDIDTTEDWERICSRGR